jgi:chromosomal replication initiation ATPase DnaA
MAHTPETDLYGIVTHRKHDRKIYARFIEKRIDEKMATRTFQKAITKMVDNKLKAEIDAIVAARAALKIAEIEGANIPFRPSSDTILAIMAEVTGYTVADLKGPRRARPIARARQTAYHVLKVVRPDFSLPMIGRIMGYRDHTTIIHGLEVFERLHEEEPMATYLTHPAIVELLKSP